jgi:hypothetical protein
MKKIEPDSIKELKYMPYIVISFIAFALIVAYFDKAWLYYTWTILLVLILAIGLYDFYLWEYDYGHTLDPKAPMKFDDSFQPPLIGRKEIINFTAISMPHIAGYLLGLSVMISIWAGYLKFRFNRNIK